MKYRPVLEIFAISVIAYLLHKLFFFLNDSNPGYHDFYYPIEIIYAFFFSCSIIILLILIQVNEKSVDNVGNVFLLVTCIKIGISYAVLSPILHSGKPNVGIEKINFFIFFAIFLAIEITFTIRILTNKQ